MTMMKRVFVDRVDWFRLEGEGGRGCLDVHLERHEGSRRWVVYLFVSRDDTPRLTPRHARKLAQKLNEFADRAEKHMRKG